MENMPANPQSETVRRIGRLYIMFERAMALLLLALAIQYWMRIVGIFDGPQQRFDTMTEQWRFAAATLAVLLPAAALGLWSGQGWGVVLWLAVVIVETAMHTLFSSHFGPAPLRIAFHLASLAAFAGFLAANRRLANSE
jgi:hypothetical protein